MEKRFSALRFIGTAYKVLGILAAIMTVLGIAGFCLMTVAGGAMMGNLGDSGREFGRMGMVGGTVGAVIGSIFWLIYGGAVSVTLYGLGEGVYLALSIEENTRTTARLLDQQAKPPATPGV